MSRNATRELIDPAEPVHSTGRAGRGWGVRLSSWARRSTPARTRFYVYLAIIHLVFAGVTFLFLRHNRPWLLALEAFFLLSAIVSVRLIRSLNEPTRLLQSGLQLLREGDYTTRFRQTGQRELDDLARIYNGMVDRLRAERIRSQEQEGFLLRVLAATPSGVLTFDFDGRIVLANEGAGAMLGRKPEDLVGVRLSDLEGGFAEALDALPMGATQVLPLSGRRRVKCQKGEFFDRSFARPFVLMEELTEELRRSEKAAYDKLIRMMSHEVNNTSGSVNSLLQSCLRYASSLPEAEAQEFAGALEVAMRRTTHMNAFMRRFAEVVRIPPPSRSPADLHELLRGIVQLFEREAAEKRIRLECVFMEADEDDLVHRNGPRAPTGSAGPLVDCDVPQFEQVLVNVVRNAMEAIGGNGCITLRTGMRGPTPFVLIEDTGPGFSAEVGHNLFSPFYTTKENGQGVGLTLVREILDAHGFEYSLDSRPGQPTRFLILCGSPAQA